MELWGRLNMHRHAYSLHDKLGFWGWLKRPLKPTHPTQLILPFFEGNNRGRPQVVGNVVLSTTLLSNQRCGQALEQRLE